MTDFYFTFGQRHVSATGYPLKDHWIRITAPDSGTARTCMSLLFGPKWSFQYTEEKMNKHYFPKGEYLHIICNSVVMSEEINTAHNKELNKPPSER